MDKEKPEMKIVIPGIPIAKARHKLCRRGQFASMYDPQETQKKSTSLQISLQIKQPYEISVHFAYSLNMRFFCPYPKDYFPWIVPLHTYKCDLDNYVKYYLDCSNKILFNDDKQIVEIYAKKLYSDQPRTEIEIMPLEIPQIDDKVIKVMKIFDPHTLKSMLNDTHTLNVVSQKLDKGQLQPDYCSILTAAASLLLQFAIKYKDLLSKIVKVGEIPCDLTPFENTVGDHPTEIY